METVVAWLVRYLHVVGAVIWVGAYAVTAFALAPRLADGAASPVASATLAVARLASRAGLVTLLAGVLLIPLSRGFEQLFTSTWGVLVLAAMVLSVVLLGVGDGALRPALRRAEQATGAPEAAGAARRFATAAFLIGIGILAVMLVLPRLPR